MHARMMALLRCMLNILFDLIHPKSPGTVVVYNIWGQYGHQCKYLFSWMTEVPPLLQNRPQSIYGPQHCLIWAARSLLIRTSTPIGLQLCS